MNMRATNRPPSRAIDESIVDDLLDAPLQTVQQRWNRLACTDPMWAIIPDPERRERGWTLREFLQTGLYEIDSLMAYLKLVAPRGRRIRAMDFGCGIGRLTQAFADHYEYVDGVDIAPSMIERARELNPHGPRCAFHLNECRDLSAFPADAYHLVHSVRTLQYMPADAAVHYIAEFVRLLAPGGLMVIQVPAGRIADPDRGANVADLLRERRGYSYGYLVSPHELTAITPEEVREVVSTAGAHVIDTQRDEKAGPEWISLRYCVQRPLTAVNDQDGWEYPALVDHRKHG